MPPTLLNRRKRGRKRGTSIDTTENESIEVHFKKKKAKHPPKKQNPKNLG